MSDSNKYFEQAKAIGEEIKSATIEGAEALEQFRIKYLGSKNILKGLFGEIRNIANERKKEYGQLVNSIKQSAEARFAELKDSLAEQSSGASVDMDLTLPPASGLTGGRHPLSLMREEIIDIFSRIGFVVAEGPEIEDDWHNFTALNTPEHHPARDMQDTFYIQRNPDVLLRSHTSTVQVRTMETQKPPIKILSPGRTYRNETISARAHCVFQQVEGLYIDKGVSFADLKQTLLYFSKELYGQDVEIRLRPSFFPFTEPSAELDITCLICKGDGCPVCKGAGWVELGGCGMVDPSVLESCGINPEVYSGFAFGCGIERIAMLKYRINDIRLFSENDVRFLKQFQAVV